MAKGAPGAGLAGWGGCFPELGAGPAGAVFWREWVLRGRKNPALEAGSVVARVAQDTAMNGQSLASRKNALSIFRWSLGLDAPVGAKPRGSQLLANRSELEALYIEEPLRLWLLTLLAICVPFLVRNGISELGWILACADSEYRRDLGFNIHKTISFELDIGGLWRVGGDGRTLRRLAGGRKFRVVRVASSG